jgi:tRNA pseudouridine38-40 synthase
MMVEAAMLYAQGTLTLDQLEAQLSCHEKHTSRLAPPEGLYLARVLY